MSTQHQSFLALNRRLHDHRIVVPRWGAIDGPKTRLFGLGHDFLVDQRIDLAGITVAQRSIFLDGLQHIGRNALDQGIGGFLGRKSAPALKAVPAAPPPAATPEPEVDLVRARPGRALPGDVDLIILPGSKATISDLAALRADGSVVHTFKPAPKTIAALAAHPRGGCVAAACFGGVCLWDTDDFAVQKEVPYANGIHALVWSPDNRWLVSGNQDPSVHLWIPAEDVESTVEVLLQS